ncbi:phosphoheptose isomerase [Candidatus Pacearchaeota archaeon]|nr:MAG: phosphoheptose isomerase [Candidatus Pacearchaeota archaeon]
MGFEEIIDTIFKRNIEEHINVIKDIRYVNIKEAALRIYDSFHKGNRLYIFGNGGSAADAQHIVGELVGRFKLERKPLPAMSLTTNTSMLTAWSNDYDYSSIFERQVEAHTKEGDILMGISTSGNSENVINAFKKGKEIGTYNIALTGKTGGRLKEVSDLVLGVNSNDVARIQEGHTLLYHTICEAIEKIMFMDK